MIRIRKRRDPPRILETKGRLEREKLCKAFSRAPDAYRGGRKPFEFSRALYGHKTVRAALTEDQYGKCCFCEAVIAHTGADVEHFRPKAGFRQTRSDPLGGPGYYWLAYDWANLFLACRDCNNRHKANLFPLRDPNQRPRCHHDDVAQEQPLFVSPTDDPEKHISFRREIAYAVNDSEAGEITILELGLRRAPLTEQRRKWLRMLRALDSLLHRTPDCPEASEARAILDEATSDAGQYAGMARAAVATGLFKTKLPSGVHP